MIIRKQTSIKVDLQAWEAARDIFKEYNLTLSDANIFLNKVRLEGGMTFDIKLKPSHNEDIETLIQLQQDSIHPTWDNQEDEVWDAL